MRRADSLPLDESCGPFKCVGVWRESAACEAVRGTGLLPVCIRFGARCNFASSEGFSGICRACRIRSLNTRRNGYRANATRNRKRNGAGRGADEPEFQFRPLEFPTCDADVSGYGHYQSTYVWCTVELGSLESFSGVCNASRIRNFNS